MQLYKQKDRYVATYIDKKIDMQIYKQKDRYVAIQIERQICYWIMKQIAGQKNNINVTVVSQKNDRKHN